MNAIPHGALCYLTDCSGELPLDWVGRCVEVMEGPVTLPGETEPRYAVTADWLAEICDGKALAIQRQYLRPILPPSPAESERTPKQEATGS